MTLKEALSKHFWSAFHKPFKPIIERAMPILINLNSSSITVSMSKRFFLWQMIHNMARTIENDPHLNFVSVLKSYKVLDRVLHGEIEEFYRDRNKFYFKNFFVDDRLWNLVKKDIEWVYKKNKSVQMTITKNGIIVYHNYNKNNFNILLLTIHSGTWMPEDIQKKQAISERKRFMEEDIDTHKIYGNLVLEKGGIWIDSKFSRFACDFNRAPERCILENDAHNKVRQVWKEELTSFQRKRLNKIYAEFYFTLGHLIDSYRFNIIFDGHSMRDAKGRPDISFGTRYIPNFYMPIVKSMHRKLCKEGYNHVAFNNPYGGGSILKWLNKRFTDIFIFSMEVNKKLYMSRDRKKTVQKRLDKLSVNITKIFDIEEEPDERTS